MNILNIFKNKSKMINQIKLFLEHKEETKGKSIALCHKEWLTKFHAISKQNDVFKTNMYDIYSFQDWLIEKYSGEYLTGSAMHSIRCFLRFYKRYDILNEMIKVGRKPNLEAIEIVKGYRKKGIPFRDIQVMLERRGRRYDLKTLLFWAHYDKKR